MRTPEFEAMLGPARLYPELWRLALGCCVILFCYLGTLAIGAVVLFAAVGPMEYFGWLQRLAMPKEAAPTLLLLTTFSGLMLGAILGAAACHFRGPGTLFGPAGEAWRDFRVTLAWALPAYAAATAIGFALEAPVENLAWADWAGYLPFALPLLLVQVTAEETVFRGYLQQQLAVRFRSRLAWMAMPAALFAALHWNPAAGQLVWLVLAAAFVFGLIAADLVARTGTLGAAIGLHLANNAFGLLVLGTEGSITGLARWKTPYALEAGPEMALSLGLNIVFLVVLWRLVRWALDR